MVKPKKHLGQHFLKDENIARKIVESLLDQEQNLIEIGPGTGVLTKYLVEKPNYAVIEIDTESVEYLQVHYPNLRIIDKDFLKLNLHTLFEGGKFNVIGNFPYNISSQIFFTVLDYRNSIDEVVGMIQKEVAERIASVHGNKVYGILSVLLQAYYDIEYLFTVGEHVFNPPPKVKSAVIRLKRNDRKQLPCDEKFFKNVVKQGFNNRRKTLRNSLKSLNLPDSANQLPEMDLRAEQLSVQQFIDFATTLEKLQNGAI